MKAKKKTKMNSQKIQNKGAWYLPNNITSNDFIAEDDIGVKTTIDSMQENLHGETILKGRIEIDLKQYSKYLKWRKGGGAIAELKNEKNTDDQENKKKK